MNNNFIKIDGQYFEINRDELTFVSVDIMDMKAVAVKFWDIDSSVIFFGLVGDKVRLSSRRYIKELEEVTREDYEAYALERIQKYFPQNLNINTCYDFYTENDEFVSIYKSGAFLETPLEDSWHYLLGVLEERFKEKFSILSQVAQGKVIENLDNFFDEFDKIVRDDTRS